MVVLGLIIGGFSISFPKVHDQRVNSFLGLSRGSQRLNRDHFGCIPDQAQFEDLPFSWCGWR